MHDLLSSADFFPKSTFSKEKNQEYHQSDKQFAIRSGFILYVRPDLDPNLMQRLSADDMRGLGVCVEMERLTGCLKMVPV